MKKIKVVLCAILALITLTSFVACNNDNATEDSENSKVKFYFTYNDVKVVMGADADGIIESLGEPQERREIGDCGGLGAQVLYLYPSVEIYVLESKSGNVIDQISFRDDIVSTPEGVYIGMSVSEAKDALGEPDNEASSSFEYENGDYVLVITHNEGKIRKIDYITK